MGQGFQTSLHLAVGEVNFGRTLNGTANHVHAVALRIDFVIKGVS